MSIITPDKMTIAELRHYQQTGEMPKAGKVINNTYANKFDRSTFFDTELKPIFSWVGGKGRYIKHIDHLLMRVVLMRVNLPFVKDIMKNHMNSILPQAQ